MSMEKERENNLQSSGKREEQELSFEEMGSVAGGVDVGNMDPASCPHKNVRHPGIRLERTKIQGDNGFRISLKRMYVYECPDCGARWESETPDYKPWELTK